MFRILEELVSRGELVSGETRTIIYFRDGFAWGKEDVFVYFGHDDIEVSVLDGGKNGKHLRSAHSMMPSWACSNLKNRDSSRS